MRSLPLILIVIFAMTACSAKRNGFLGAEDLPYAPLPGENDASQYVLTPKGAAEKQLVFINLPLPPPSFVAAPPQKYPETFQQNKHRFVQSISLGLNSNKKPSLLIQPAFSNDINDLLKALKDNGFSGGGDSLVLQSSFLEGTITQAYVRDNEDIIFVHLDSVLASAETSKKKSRKERRLLAQTSIKFNDMGFELLDKVRRDYMRFQ